jgi:Ala-tRNA(Pro) deacylase
MNKLIGCKKGMVNIFSMLNDTEKKVKIILDQRLFDAEWASFHPMDNTASTAINKEGILKLKELTGREDAHFEVVEFSTFGNANAAPKKAKEDKPKGKAGQT